MLHGICRHWASKQASMAPSEKEEAWLAGWNPFLHQILLFVFWELMMKETGGKTVECKMVFCSAAIQEIFLAKEVDHNLLLRERTLLYDYVPLYFTIKSCMKGFYKFT